MESTDINCLDPGKKCLESTVDIYGPHHLHVGSCRRFYHLFEERKQTTLGVHIYFCDWYPELFGIDEDEIPLSDEDEEGLFDIGWDDLEEQAAALTESELDSMRVGSRRCLQNDEMREYWMRNQRPRYGRRARQKQVYLDDNNEPFECICKVDLHYGRHYVPHFGGGVPKEGEEFKIPHFKAFWEDFKERGEIGDVERVSNIFKDEEPEEDKGVLQRPTFKFKETSKRSLMKMRKELLASFRPLQCREVRRYRMPYSEAMYLELQEDNCLDGAAFFKHLLIKDYFVHQAPDNFEPCLRDNKYVLNKLFDILKLGERYSKREEYHKETYLYLRTGKHFNDHNRNWWWLAEEFFTRAVKVSEKCVIDGGKAEAISNYILGTFLLECVDRVQPAQEHLLKARELSMGKDWSAKNILQKHQDTVHKECATYLCRALIAVSKELRSKGKPEEALPLIHRSYKLCKELGSGRGDIEMETYFELGLTYQAVGMIDWAKVAFKKFIGLAEMQNFDRGICDGYLELAICSRSEGDVERCHRNIISYLTAARKKGNKNLFAFGNRYLGEILLNNAKPEEAHSRLVMAFESFLAQCNECSEIPFQDRRPEHFTLPADVELTRVLSGLAEGQLLTRPICSLIFDAKDKKCQSCLLNLIKWKNTGEREMLADVTKDMKKTKTDSPAPMLFEDGVSNSSEAEPTFCSTFDNWCSRQMQGDDEEDEDDDEDDDEDSRSAGSRSEAPSPRSASRMVHFAIVGEATEPLDKRIKELEKHRK